MPNKSKSQLSPFAVLVTEMLSFRGVVFFWIAYGIAHSILRLSITRTLTLDDARASELVQTLSAGYQLRQPPLYEWLLWFSQRVFGAGIESHLIVRYSLIAALGIATYGAVRAATNSVRWGAVASFSLVLSYPVGWTFHEWATQTIVLSVSCMATLHAAILFLKKPGAREAVLLGLAMACGFYSKFSYPLFLAALLFAVISIPETRARLADRRLLLSVAIVVAALLPFVLWIAGVQGDLVSTVSEHMVQETQSHFWRALIGLGRLVKSIPLFLLPWFIFVALLAPAAFIPGAKGKRPAGIGETLALRTMLIAAALAAAGIAAAGATNIAERYMHPILIVAPVFAFARIARFTDNEALIRQSVAFSTGAAIFLLAFRFIAATDNPLTQRALRGLFKPYSELSATLGVRGVSSGTVVTSSVRDAGNLRAFNPQLRVKAQESYLVVPPPRRAADDKSCVLIWGAGEEGDVVRMISLDRLKPEKIEIARPRSRIFATRGDTWFIAPLDPASKLCS